MSYALKERSNSFIPYEDLISARLYCSNLEDSKRCWITWKTDKGLYLVDDVRTEPWFLERKYYGLHNIRFSLF